ncbi:MAG: tetratricopeptide repeat protein [Elusimicrobia bacterium]|nr:tetratricopeptide repeat protein [Elusimicrobiota bacterium]
MNLLGILFVGTVVGLNLLLPSLKDDNFDYWFKKAVNSNSPLVKIECYTEAIKLYKDSVGTEKRVETYYNRGLAYISSNLYDDAISDFTKAIALNPKYVKAYVQRGNIYYYKLMYKESIDDYTAAIELKPDFAGAYNNRGIAYDDIKLYDKAINDYSKAIMLKPGYANAYHNRGITYYKKKQFDKARTDFTKAGKYGYIYSQNVSKKIINE